MEGSYAVAEENIEFVEFGKWATDILNDVVHLKLF